MTSSSCSRTPARKRERLGRRSSGPKSKQWPDSPDFSRTSGKFDLLVYPLLIFRENSEMLIAIKKMSPDGKIPRGLLLNGRPAIKDTYKEFE